MDAEELALEQAVQITGGTGESIMYSSDDIEKDDIHCCNLSHLE